MKSMVYKEYTKLTSFENIWPLQFQLVLERKKAKIGDFIVWGRQAEDMREVKTNRWGILLAIGVAALLMVSGTEFVMGNPA